MKKAAAALFLFLLSALPAGADSPTGVVTTVTGDAAVVRRGSLIPAVSGMDVRKDDVLRAGTGGSMDVSLNGLAGCRLLSSTEVRVDGVAREDMRLSVVDGNVILNLQKLGGKSKFRVETPTAVASVRGTQFWGRVDAAGGDAVTTFAVREGAVDVLAKGARRTFRLKPGQALDIPRVGKPASRDALEEEMQAMEQASTIKTAA